MREAWSDDRLDDLNGKVDEGFRRVSAEIRTLRSDTKAEIHELHGEMNQRFDKVDTRFEHLEARFETRFDSLHRTQVLLCVAVITGLIGVIASILATGA